MIGRGQWDSASSSLFVRFQEADWHIMIRRRDGKLCERLRSYDGCDMSADALKELLPNWESLPWHPCRISNSYGLCAQQDQLKVKLLTTAEGPLSDAHIMRIITEFKGFMANAQKT